MILGAIYAVRDIINFYDSSKYWQEGWHANFKFVIQ